MSSRFAPAPGAHRFSRDCVEFWRYLLESELEDWRYGRMTAARLRQMRPIIRDAGGRVPSAESLNRLESGGDWIDALRDQVMLAAPSQIEVYARNYAGEPFQCPACEYGM